MSMLDAIDGTPSAAPARSMTKVSKGRVLFWSIRREVWEHPSLWAAPTIVALLMLLAFTIGATHLAEGLHVMLTREGGPPVDLLIQPLGLTAIPIALTIYLVATVYCADALHGERKDRSILFWKSLPVSDTMTVMAKVLVPVILMPAIGSVVFVVFQALLMLVGTIVLAMNGVDGGSLWTLSGLVTSWGEMIVWIFSVSLWYAPLYAWFLLVSAWLTRSPVLATVLIPLVLALCERLAFGTRYVSDLFEYQIARPLEFAAHHDAHHIGTPPQLLGDPGLWIGLVVAAVLIGLAIVSRRHQQPI
jgi:ABC-2 type transport system permease protein